MKKFYAGVGSRETPPEILDLMTEAARWLRREGWILRSGHAPGADWAFEQGAEKDSVIYLPWPSFGQVKYQDDPGRPVLGEAICLPRSALFVRYEILVKDRIHSRARSDSVKMLHGRNHAQIFGHLETEPASAFVLCWCEEVGGKPQGGTATAVKLARKHGIPVYNLWLPEDLEWVRNGITAGRK